MKKKISGWFEPVDRRLSEWSKLKDPLVEKAKSGIRVLVGGKECEEKDFVFRLKVRLARFLAPIQY